MIATMSFTRALPIVFAATCAGSALVLGILAAAGVFRLSPKAPSATAGVSAVATIAAVAPEPPAAARPAAPPPRARRESPSSPPTKFLFFVSAATMIRDYENEAAVAAKYGRDPIAVDGVVREVRRDFSKRWLLEIGTGKDFEIPTIECRFADESQLDVAAKLRKGDKVRVVGVTGQKLVNIELDACSILEP